VQSHSGLIADGPGTLGEVLDIHMEPGRSWSQVAVRWEYPALAACGLQKFSDFMLHNFILLKHKLGREEISPL